MQLRRHVGTQVKSFLCYFSFYQTILKRTTYFDSSHFYAINSKSFVTPPFSDLVPVMRLQRIVRIEENVLPSIHRDAVKRKTRSLGNIIDETLTDDGAHVRFRATLLCE